MSERVSEGVEEIYTPPAAYLVDLDGTLYANGAAIAGAPEAIARLRRNGVPFRLVTNTTSRSRLMLVERLRGYGFEVEPDELFTATLAGAAAARAAGYRTVAPFLPAAALDDLAGVTLAGGTARGRLDPRTVPDAVLMGDLGDAWNYALLQEAFEYLMGGAALLALSRDRYWLKDGRLALDVGAFVAALEYAVGRQAEVAGKPSAAFYGAALRSLGCPAEPGRVAMIGDDLWSDVRGAQQAGIGGWLVRTGKFRAEVLEQSGIVPDRILDSIRDLA